MVCQSHLLLAAAVDDDDDDDDDDDEVVAIGKTCCATQAAECQYAMIGISKFSHLVKSSVEALLIGISKFSHLVKLFVEAALIGISKVFRSSGKLPQDVSGFLCSTPSIPHPAVETGDRQFADLPTDVLTLVLSLLKTRDAVRTSILSAGWKNKRRRGGHVSRQQIISSSQLSIRF